MRIEGADHNSGGVSLGTSGPGHAVPVVPLDDLVAQIPGLRLLKVDVEGMEKVTLEGASRLIATHRPLLYVENDRVEKSRELITFIQQAGYRLWWHMPALFNPANFFGVEVNAYPNIVSFNMFCQPREAAVDVDSALQEITGQKPVRCKARKSIAAFRLRAGLEVGCKVTLRRARMYEFLDRLISLALPRVRDFRGLNPEAFDGQGNYSLGLSEQLVFPELNPD